MVCRLVKAGAVGALALLALSGCEPAQELSTWPLALKQLGGTCGVGEPSEIELVALGDFPSRSYPLRSEQGQGAIDDVPLELRELLVRVKTPLGVAEGRRVMEAPRNEADPQRQGVWLLRPGLSCPLADTALGVSEGAVAAALPQGGALLAGGTESQFLASSHAFVLVEGLEFGVMVEGGMLLRRAAASATPWRDAVVIAGGTPDRRAGAHDTYELFDLASARFDAARSGKLKAARMQHAAVLLPDERVLLVGGRAEPPPQGEPLASAELLDLARARTELLEAALEQPRVAPSALTLDSGSVLILGGRDGAGQVLGSVERYVPEQARFVLAASDLPAREHLCVAALPGARAAWLSCDHAGRGGGGHCELALLAERDGELQVTPVALSFDALTPNGLSDLQLIYVGHGQLLWTGADDSDPTGRRRAFLIDVAAESLQRVDASRVPTQLLRLENGLIAELDAAGASLRAAFTRGRYASPEDNMLEDAEANLVLDAPGHWLWQGAGLQALTPGARMDVGELRFAAFRGAVQVQGDHALVLYDGLGHNTQLRVRGGVLDIEGCRAQLQGDAGLQLRRAGSRLEVAGTTCTVELPAGALGIALMLEKSAVVYGLTFQRM